METETADLYFYLDVHLKNVKYARECKSRLKNLWVEKIGNRLDYLHSGVNSSFTCFFVSFNNHINNISYYNILKMKI